jgi:Tol biopolymer transport system component
MKPILLSTVVVAMTVVLVGSSYAQERDAEITPSTIRIQSTESPKDGSWVLMPGFKELGSPCFSRDGRWIAFDGYKDGFKNSAAESWIVRRDGQRLTRLAAGATPRWSPDGKQLLFVREQVNNRKSEHGIYQIDRDGAHERRIGPGRWPDWSPDGKEIVFSLGGEERGGARAGATICIAKADGSDQREITPGDCPSWSPDGKKIAFCFKGLEPTPVIRVHDLDTKQEKTLGIGWFRANWMPDNKTVIANGVIGGEIRMVRLSPAAPFRPTELRTAYEEAVSPCCTWDGQYFAYIAKRPKSEEP